MSITPKTPKNKDHEKERFFKELKSRKGLIEFGINT